MPTPNSIMKQPLEPPGQFPVDAVRRRFLSLILFQYSFKDAISVTSPPPAPMVPAHPSSKNATSGLGLPTPQTVSHGSKTRSRADSPSHLHTITESCLVTQNGSSFCSSVPHTPSRSKTKHIDHTVLAPRTTPQSQRMVPSSQFIADEQNCSASSLEVIVGGKDPFLLYNPREHGHRSEELALPPLFKVPPYPLARVPTAPSSSSSLPFASVSSGACSFRHRSQTSQIEPTSQFDEVELKFSQAIQPPVLCHQANHDTSASTIKRYSRLFSLSNLVLMIHMVQIGTRNSTKPECPCQR